MDDMRSTPPLLSIIYPIYNAEKWLQKTFQSVVDQTFTNREIIVVDDGSTDGSVEIVKQFQAQFPEIKLISQQNGGVSLAKNAGLQMATGKYIALPDSDDILHPEQFSKLMELCLKDDLDMATCNGTYIQEGQPNKPIFPNLQSTETIKGLDWLQIALKSRKFLHVTWLNIYKRDFLLENKMQFVPKLGHQDILWTTEALILAKKCRYLNECLYDYLLHENSVSHSPSEKRRMGTVRSYMEIVLRLDEINQKYFHTLKATPKTLRWQITKEGMGIFNEIQSLETESLKQELFQEMKQRNIISCLQKNTVGFRQWQRLFRRIQAAKPYF